MDTDIDIGEVNVVRVVLEELSSSEGESDESSEEEESFTEKCSSTGDDCRFNRGDEENGEHKVMDMEENGEQKVREMEEDGEKKVREMKEDGEQEVEKMEEEDAEHQGEVDERHNVEGDSYEHQREENDELGVEGDDAEHQTEENDELGVEDDGQDLVEGDNDHSEDGNFPMSSLKICYTMTLAPSSETSETGDGGTMESSRILQTGELLANQVSSSKEVKLQEVIKAKNAIIQEQEMEINSLHGENMTLQKRLQGAMTCIRDLQEEIIRFKKDVEAMEFLQDKNEKDKRDQSPKAKSPEISCSQQLEVTTPENDRKSSILVDRSSDLEPPAAKKAKKRVSFNLTAEDSMSIRRSERIFLSSDNSNNSPVDSDEDAQNEKIPPIMPMEAKNCEPTVDAKSSNLHGWNKTNTSGFFCTCGMQYASKAKLFVHVRKHSIGMMFKCADCDKKFYHRYLYRLHMRMTHGVKTLDEGFGCGFCGANFQNRSQLFKHQKTAHNVVRGAGRSKLLKKPKLLKPRKSPVIKDAPTPVPIPIHFPTPVSKALVHQIDEARLSEGFYCTCGHKAVHRISLSMHVRHYTCGRNFICTVCEHRSQSLQDLKRHMASVHKITYQRKNGCRDCGSCFETRKELFYHLADVHDNGPLAKNNQRSKGKHLVVKSPITLETGSKANNGNGTLEITEEHTIISAQAAYDALLGLKLKRETVRSTKGVAMVPEVPPSVLEVNQMEEDIEKSIVAIEVWNVNDDDEEQCQLLEIQPEDEHLRILEIESGEEDDSPMEQVQKTELNASSLEHGLMGMRGDDVWLCVCGTQFQTERSLQSHVLLKSGMKPYKCQFCNEAFPRRDYLTYHYNQRHGGEGVDVLPKLFTCRVCGMQMKSMKKLKAHKARMHQNGTKAAVDMQPGQLAFARASLTSRKRKYPQ